MQREIARFSLCVMLALGVRAEAVPWREKGAIRFASSLPKRLIDSIMAQGNWNLLFQEGPFAEFQRQIAIANYFALRGESGDAEQYFKKAESALTIAYASLRGKYDWPRLPQGLVAKDLPWGENRETFQDFVLCSLQLYLESGLRAHESGKIDFEAIEPALANAERQLSASIRQKDADLFAFVSLLQDALKIRQARQLNALEKADRFAERSSLESGGGKNYWNRRAFLFRIFENIHHGNLGRARAMADDLYQRQGDQLDPLAAARIYVATAAYDEAEKICEEALRSNDQKLAENQINYIRHSVLLQNLRLLRRQFETAERTAKQTAEHLQAIFESGVTANEERVALRRSLRDQQLRSLMFAFLHDRRCPAANEFTDTLEMEPEWRVKARLFYENCGLRHDRLWWQAIVTTPGAGSEISAIAAYADRRLTEKMAAGSDLLRLLLNHQQLIGARPKGPAAENAVTAYLQLAPDYPADFLFLDWGIVAPEIADAELIALLPQKLESRQALKIFTALHRNYAARITRGAPLNLFVPPDAARLSRHNSGRALDQVRPEPSAPEAFRVQHSLRYGGDNVEIFYDRTTGRLSQNSSAAPAVVNFGRLGVQVKFTAQRQYLAPLYFWCENCRATSERPARLFVDRGADRAWRTTFAEIADTFSLTLEYNSLDACGLETVPANDSLLLNGGTRTTMLQRCPWRSTNLVIDEGARTSPMAAQMLLTLGWRSDLSAITLPAAAPVPMRTALLYDFFQRKNRRGMPSTTAFQESYSRAEKSFSADSAFERIQFYESLD